MIAIYSIDEHPSTWDSNASLIFQEVDAETNIYDVEKDRHNGSKYESDIDEFKERIYEQIDVLAGKFYNG
jgi:hypothetical protein